MIKILIILLLVSSTCYANTRDGLIGWWKFDVGIGTYEPDSSWNGGTATATGTTIINSCQKSNCRLFNGSSEYLTIGGTSFPSIGNVPSITALIKPNSFSATTGGIFGQSNTSSALHFRLNNAGNVDVFIPGIIIARTTATVPLNVWSCIAFTRNVGPVNRIYINGINQSLSLDNGSSFTNTTTNKQIGQRGNSTEFFSGNLDDIRLYNRTLTQQEVIDVCNSGIILSGTGTIIRGTGTKLNY